MIWLPEVRSTPYPRRARVGPMDRPAVEGSAVASGGWVMTLRKSMGGGICALHVGWFSWVNVGKYIPATWMVWVIQPGNKQIAIQRQKESSWSWGSYLIWSVCSLFVNDWNVDVGIQLWKTLVFWPGNQRNGGWAHWRLEGGSTKVSPCSLWEMFERWSWVIRSLRCLWYGFNEVLFGKGGWSLKDEKWVDVDLSIHCAHRHIWLSPWLAVSFPWYVNRFPIGTSGAGALSMQRIAHGSSVKPQWWGAQQPGLDFIGRCASQVVMKCLSPKNKGNNKKKKNRNRNRRNRRRMSNSQLVGSRFLCCCQIIDLIDWPQEKDRHLLLQSIQADSCCRPALLITSAGVLFGALKTSQQFFAGFQWLGNQKSSFWGSHQARVRGKLSTLTEFQWLDFLNKFGCSNCSGAWNYFRGV